MSGYLAYLAKRLGQFALVVFIGVNLAYVITHATPIDPVEQSISAVTSFGNTAPEAIEQMRQSLRSSTACRARGGSSISPSGRASSGPTSGRPFRRSRRPSGSDRPRTALDGGPADRCHGDHLGAGQPAGRAGRLLPEKPLLEADGRVAMGMHPIPYYIVALMLLIVFGFLWPVLPIGGGSTMNLPQGWTALRHERREALHPAGAVPDPDRTWELVPGHALAGVERRHRGLRDLCGARRRGPPPHPDSYVMRNALAPQVTGLAMSLGGIFNGAIITEKVFGYPGIGTLLVDGVYAGDYGLVLGVTTMSILGVSFGVLADRPALSLARSPRAGDADAGDPARPPEVQHRVPDRARARRDCARLAALSFFSPYPPVDVYVVPPDVPPARPTGSAPPRAARTCSGS